MPCLPRPQTCYVVDNGSTHHSPPTPLSPSTALNKPSSTLLPESFKKTGNLTSLFRSSVPPVQALRYCTAWRMYSESHVLPALRALPALPASPTSPSRNPERSTPIDRQRSAQPTTRRAGKERAPEGQGLTKGLLRRRCEEERRKREDPGPSLSTHLIAHLPT